ncbi:MAG: PTS sugar transporter subunit IIA [Candidatus Latescibacterota bacterium]
MNLYEMIDASNVVLNLEGKDRRTIIHKVLQQLHGANETIDPEDALEKVLKREELGGTGIGFGVAVPHARISSAKEIVVAVGIAPKGIDFEAMDGQPARLIFLVLAPEKEAETYLKVMARISRLMRKEEVREALLACERESEVAAIIERYEA